MARLVKIFVDKEQTAKWRGHDDDPPRGEGTIVATFDEHISLYRVMDGNELRHIVRTKKILGGFFAVKGERAFGASWGENITQVIEWGLSQAKRGHLHPTKDLFLAKIGAYQKLFFHMNPKVDWDPNSESQVFTMDASQCSTGLGCSVYDVSYYEATFYSVDPTGRITELTDAQVRAYAAGKPFKPVEMKIVTPGTYSHGVIHGVDVYAVFRHDDSAYDDTWSVIARGEKPVVIGARSEKIAVTRAAEVLRVEGGVPEYPLDLLPKSRKLEWMKREQQKTKWQKLGIKLNPAASSLGPAAALVAGLAVVLYAATKS